MAALTNPAKQQLLVEPLPDYLQGDYSPDDNKEWEVPSSTPIGRVSIEGKEFKLLFDNDVGPLEDNEGYPAKYWDFVFVKAHPDTSRKYYKTGFVKGSKSPPDCASLNGIKPEPGSPEVQSPTCGTCDWSRFNTATGPDGLPGKGQACQQYKRAGVLLSGDMVNADWGGVMLMTIPPTSFKAFIEYQKAQDKLGRSLWMLNTRVSFEPVPHSQLKFECMGFITKEERAAVLEWRDVKTEGGEFVERMLRIEPAAENSEEAHVSYNEPAQQAAPAPAPASAPAPAPAPQAARAPQIQIPQATPPQTVPPHTMRRAPAAARIPQSAEAPLQPASRQTQAPTTVRARAPAPSPTQPPQQAPQQRRAAPQTTQTGNGQTRPRGTPTPPTTSPVAAQQQLPIEETEFGELDQIVSDLGDNDFEIPTT